MIQADVNLAAADAPAATLEDRFAGVAADDSDAPGAGHDPRSDEDDIAEEDAPDEGGPADPDDGEAPGASAAPAPPVSWTAAEKDAFAQLPRSLQETLTRREGERERFVQAKAQEARHARSEVEREALEAIQELQSTYAQHLHHFEAQLAVSEPDPRLIASDPELYAAQLAQHRHYTAQRQQAQQLLAQVQQQSAFAEAEIAARESEETRAVLAASFPEYLDPDSGPKLRQELGSTALALGYSPDQLAAVDHVDILAMRLANEWRQDALKYRALIASKPDHVRAARDMPRVSRPGTSPARGAADSQRYAADRQRMKHGDRDAATRVFGRFL